MTRIGRHRWSALRFVLIGWLLLIAVAATETSASAQATDEPQEPQPASNDQLAESQSIVLRAFGAVQWGRTEDPGRPNSFTLGQFALFATSSLSERISVLAEVVLESGTDTRVVTDLERLQLTYHFNDYFSLTAGRYHTGIGYYNAAFHHGAFFEIPIGRPRVFAFEDEGGVIPVHETGVTVNGIVPRTGRALRYLAEVGNGRNWNTADHESATQDTNPDKAVNLGVSIRPERWRGFEAGTSYYRDSIAAVDGVGPDVKHRINAVFVIYRKPVTEFMAEWLRFTHLDAGGTTFVNYAGYVQVAQKVNVLTPYYRYDRMPIKAATPFIGTLTPFSGHTLGVRVDAGPWVGLKAQYEHADAGSQRGLDAFRTQLVFVF